MEPTWIPPTIGLVGSIGVTVLAEVFRRSNNAITLHADDSDKFRTSLMQQLEATQEQLQAVIIERNHLSEVNIQSDRKELRWIRFFGRIGLETDQLLTTLGNVLDQILGDLPRDNAVAKQFAPLEDRVARIRASLAEVNQFVEQEYSTSLITQAAAEEKTRRNEQNVHG